MTAVRLTGGYYQARNLVASAQRALNLFPEAIPQNTGEPAPVADYPTPGLRSLGTPTSLGPARCLYAATDGTLYAVVGSGVYTVSSTWVYTLIGNLSGSATTPVSMQDNGIDMLIADGSGNSYSVVLETHAFSSAPITDYNGATRLDFVDTYIVGNVPGTKTFFSSDSNAITFDPLFVANKSAYPDQLMTLAVIDREIWLIGAQTTEIWIDVGNEDFPFQIMEGPFIQHGCWAPYSLARQGQALFWLSADQFGTNIAVMGKGYEANRISTHAVEAAWGQYSITSDAIGFCYQQGGHQFWMLTFPGADRTWCYDVATGLWHERAWTDGNGKEHRHRAVCGAFAYGENVVADWETGALYAFDLDVYTDNGAPIVRRRGFPHMLQDAKRRQYSTFIADVAAGETTVTGEPQILLRWSDDRGITYGNPVSQSFGAMGEYLTSVQWQRMGIARDRVFELYWSENLKTVLQGAWVTSKTLGT